MEIKDRIKELRTILGLTQAKFAERVAIVPSFISEIEGGVRDINERAIRLIIAEYNVNENWLRYGQAPMFNEDMSATVSEAMGLFKFLDEHHQDGALKILTTLVEMNNALKSSPQ
jgi:transcriptional regulator with XRE-family HTH domain